jgi:flagellar protein FlaG
MEVGVVDNIGNAGLSGNISQPSSAIDSSVLKKNEPAQEDSDQGKQVSSEMLKIIAETVQAQIDVMNSSLSFQAYGKNNDKCAIIVSDRTTGKVIREIPPKEVQQMQAKFDELIGLIFNGSA